MTKIFDVETVGRKPQQSIRAPDYVRNPANAADEPRENLAARGAKTLDVRVRAGAEAIDRIRFLLIGSWHAAAGALAWRHVVWRDEARALSIATQGEDWIAMLRGLHGEGHPALWYLLLRAAHAIARQGAMAAPPAPASGLGLSVMGKG